ncbi:unnamed protein product [Parnassius apollo]|uniref:(apollo) hypothetical protein n=1 Tax=Parnassius apollo TaxID=110799 RepID=A0A8S3YBT1_PARAO|nr:unnamed protein product [Parnassius apollo]
MYIKPTYIVILQLFYCNVLTIDPCENYNTCDECIGDPKTNCVWCAKEDWSELRCRSIYHENWCLNHTISPKNSVIKTDDRSFSSDLGKAVQIRPQEYKVKLRIGQEINFNFSYEAAKDYPVDIYFLIDVSLSMADIKSKTANKSENIYFAISNLTSNVFLGLGTFVDKNAIPFNTFYDSTLTYSFKHHLNFTRSYENFKKVLNEVPLGQNYDTPEGGLDALAQVMVCKEELGWRTQSRKIVVLLTDGTYHAAGDGRLAGIVKPYDGKCYMKNNVYSNELSMDYPSVSMIGKLAADEQITVVFAVKNSMQSVYTKLSNSVRNSWSTTYESADMDVILKEIYEEITQSIKLDIRSPYRKKFDINFIPDCLEKRSDECNIKTGQQTNFTGRLKLLDYIEADNFLVDVLIGGVKENLKLNIDVIKKCDCETEVSSIKCNAFGNRRCGICECNPGRYGDKCECTATSSSRMSDNSSCIAPGHTELCSGHGFCHCGSCHCRERYNGRYCECNQNSCTLDTSGAPCNGRGNCLCGVCTCTSSDWYGAACECYKPKTPCITDDGKLCNNRGQCECGECTCEPIAQWDARFYQDKFCRITPCPDCHNRQCNLLESCAKCHHAGTANCSDCNTIIRVNVTQTLGEFNITDGQWNVCYFETNGICYSRFMYRYDDNNYSIEMYVQTDIDCAESYYMFGGMFLIALILIGIATLVAWKLLTDARDRREYELFQKQRAEDMSDTRRNPCFKPPTMTFANPVFRKKSTNQFKL